MINNAWWWKMESKYIHSELHHQAQGPGNESTGCISPILSEDVCRAFTAIYSCLAWQALCSSNICSIFHPIHILSLSPCCLLLFLNLRVCLVSLNMKITCPLFSSLEILRSYVNKWSNLYGLFGLRLILCQEINLIWMQRNYLYKNRKRQELLPNQDIKPELI